MTVRDAGRVLTRTLWWRLTAPRAERGWVFLAIDHHRGIASIAESRFWIRTRLAKAVAEAESRRSTGSWSLVGPFRRNERGVVFDRFGVAPKSARSERD